MVAVADRALPHSLDAEKAVLGACLLNADVWPAVAAAVGPQDFYRDAHRRIYRALGRLAERRVPADLVTLVAELDAAGDKDEVGGPAYVAALLDGVPRSTNAAGYAAVVREKARLRALAAAGNALVAAAYAGDQAAADIAREALMAVQAAVPPDAGQAPAQAWAAVNGYLEALARGRLAGTPTGYLDLDELTGGLRPRELTVVAARPSVGKTAFALGMAAHLGRMGTAAAYFSVADAGVDVLASRLLQWRSHVPHAVLVRGEATEVQWHAVGAASSDFADSRLLLCDAARTLEDVAHWTRRLRGEQDLRVVVVDYLQQLGVREGRSREEDVRRISGGLKRLAVDEGVAVVALAQLNRAPDDRRDKRPHLSDLRESGALEQDADAAVLLFREEMHRPTAENDGIAEAILAKQREGPTGVTKLVFDKALAQFRNLVREAQA